MIRKPLDILIVLFLLCLCRSAFTQDSTLTDLSLWDESEVLKANSGAGIQYLSEREKEVVFFMNLARINPRLFSETLLQNYIDKNPQSNSKWVKTLKSDLKNRKPLPPLTVREDLYAEAKKHAMEMGTKGKTGHSDARGRPYKKRIGELIKTYPLMFENCYYGEGDPLEIVLDLLVDEGTPGYGHRKAILHQQVRYCGVSIQPHVKFGYNCVMEIGR